MTSFAKLGFGLLTLALFGAGCIQFTGGGTEAAKLGVFKSIDSAKSFEHSVALPTPQGVGSIASLGVRELVMDPSDRFALYLGTDENGLMYSYDGGAGWTQVREAALREGRVRAVAVDPSDKCTVYATRGQRLYKSEDCSRTFQSDTYVDPRQEVYLTDVEIDWFNSQVVYIANSEGEVHKSMNGGDTWQLVYRANGEINDLQIDVKDSRVLLAATAKRGVHRSGDGGVTWQRMLDDRLYPDLENIERTFELEQDKSGSYTWVSTEYGLALSRDQGQTWAPVVLITPPNQAVIHAMAVDANNGAHLIYASGSTLYVTEDAGVQWDTKRMPTTGLAGELLFDPSNAAVVYMGIAPVEKSPGIF
ncbi:hypothetical protein A3C17_02770 [Candidatus Uhrbacteria bacterium RIFCSPHIGHO2_02_FULL_53_13]|uniref:Photosynthesis system II assembly factor Ycf48/Hcf136-like domain-containing protein n=1 Tax=Candidatus Uhrbacteria bacterium RIFCSPHIGHO2_02_FULL_53_13 TaxID=1802389 RepID=A0A1F7U193_9BACT|nr:MAG: hypothetical protein A3C17_02770 [Candidatus Uhrbacteria bacterium RIFCSPHIGHO2_02_FULL_53_13]